MKARSIAILGVLFVMNTCGVNAPALASDSPETKKEMIHTMLLQIYEQKGSKEVAPEYLALIALRPTDDKLRFRYGLYLEKAGDDHAIIQYQKAVSLAPANADYQGALGNAYYRARNYGAAAGAYRRAVECGGGARYSTLYQSMQTYIQQQRDYQKYQKQLKDQE
jgi:tetratricopeptide (TPR) repeat protein